jgi:hypothetical protein
MSLDLVIFAGIVSALRPNVKTHSVTKSSHIPHINPHPTHKYAQGLDTNLRAS